MYSIATKLVQSELSLCSRLAAEMFLPFDFYQKGLIGLAVPLRSRTSAISPLL